MTTTERILYVMDLCVGARKRLAAAVFLLTLVHCTSPAKRSTQNDGVVTLGIVSGLSGITEPCGCTKTPLGGLARLAAAVESQQKTGPFSLLVTGDTFVEHADPPGHLFEQEREKASTIAAVLAQLRPLALVRGVKDMGVHEQFLLRTASERKLAGVMHPPRSPSTREQADSVLKTVGDLKIGVVGMPGQTAELSAYGVRANYLRRDGAQIVVALLPMGGEAAWEFAANMRGPDVVVLGGGDALRPPQYVNGKLIVEAGDKGRFLGLLRLHAGGTSNWVYDDQGQEQKRSLETRIARLRHDLERLAEGPARDVRTSKLMELEAELSGVKSAPPQGSYITWKALPISQDITPASWAAEQLKQYNRALCGITQSATASRVCPEPASTGERYVGTDACQACHPAAFEIYKGTRHAHAWSTLQEAAKDCDWTCVGCHSVGFEKPGGYCRLEQAINFANVGCENCHGPGGGHVEHPADSDQWGAGFVKSPGEQVCTTCHNKEHSDQFNIQDYLPKILGPGHGKPL